MDERQPRHFPGLFGLVSGSDKPSEYLLPSHFLKGDNEK